MADRDAYAARQAEFIGALRGCAPAPDGFDADDLAAAAASLTRKRAGEMAQAWPAVMAGLGDDALALAGRYFRHAPPPGDGEQDGYVFARWLGRARLTSAARVELALATAARRPYLGVHRDGGGWTLIVSVGRGRSAVLSRS